MSLSPSKENGNKKSSATSLEIQEEPPLNYKVISQLKRTALCKRLGCQFHKHVSFGCFSLLDSPRRFHRTKGDGNCFFRSLSFVISGSEENHLQLRDKVLAHMQERSNGLEMYLNANMESYLNESGMMHDGVWASECEILGAASMLHTDIVIFSKYGDTMK